MPLPYQEEIVIYLALILITGDNFVGQAFYDIFKPFLGWSEVKSDSFPDYTSPPSSIEHQKVLGHSLIA